MRDPAISQGTGGYSPARSHDPPRGEVNGREGKGSMWHRQHRARRLTPVLGTLSGKSASLRFEHEKGLTGGNHPQTHGQKG